MFEIKRVIRIYGMRCFLINSIDILRLENYKQAARPAACEAKAAGTD